MEIAPSATAQEPKTNWKLEIRNWLYIHQGSLRSFLRIILILGAVFIFVFSIPYLRKAINSSRFENLTEQTKAKITATKARGYFDHTETGTNYKSMGYLIFYEFEVNGALLKGDDIYEASTTPPYDSIMVLFNPENAEENKLWVNRPKP